MTAINKYNNSMIYSIRSPHTVNYYIGSTTQKLCKRFSDHNINYKAYLKGTVGFTTSFKILKLGDAYIELLEEVNCENRNQLEKREGELIREHKNNCVNKSIAGRTQKEYKTDYKEIITEYNKQYYTDNKGDISKQKKQHYNDNRESISIKSKQYYIDNNDKAIQYRIDNKDKTIKYRIDNKDKIIQYRIDNKESAKAKATLPYLCACGSTITHCSKARHNKTAKHIKALEQEIKIV